MEALIVALIILAVSGLGKIAYSHPLSYSRTVFPILMALAIIFYIGQVVWGSGVDKAFEVLIPYIDHSKFEDARTSIKGIQLPPGRTTLILFGVVAYFYLLKLLPLLLDLPALHNKEGHRNDEE